MLEGTHTVWQTQGSGDEPPINTPCESVRSAFSYTVSGTTSSPVILFCSSFLLNAYIHSLLAYGLFASLLDLVKPELFSVHVLSLLSRSPTSHIPPSLHLWLAPCITPQTCRALKLTTQGARKIVGTMKNAALCQQNSFDFWLKIREIWSDTCIDIFNGKV